MCECARARWSRDGVDGMAAHSHYRAGSRRQAAMTGHWAFAPLADATASVVPAQAPFLVSYDALYQSYLGMDITCNVRRVLSNGGTVPEASIDDSRMGNVSWSEDRETSPRFDLSPLPAPKYNLVSMHPRHSCRRSAARCAMILRGSVLDTTRAPLP